MARDWKLTLEQIQPELPHSETAIYWNRAQVVCERDMAAEAQAAKLVRWLLEWCDEHFGDMHGFKLMRKDCPACLSQLCQELGVKR